MGLRQRRRTSSGAVTAEASFGICLLLMVALGLSWIVCLGVVAVRAQDAAREAVRALARGELEAVALGLARQIATDGSAITTGTDGRLVRVKVRSPVRGPGGLFAFIGTVEVTGEAVGLREEALDGSSQ